MNKQLSLFEDPAPYKYVIDTSAILSQKRNEPFRRSLYKTLWKTIDQMVQDHIIVTCSEVEQEVHDKEIRLWMKNNKMVVLPIDDEIQENVTLIVTSVNKRLIDFKKNKSSADPFLIATAKRYNLAVITEEKKESDKKIPFTCNKMGIHCVNLNDFAEENGIIF